LASEQRALPIGDCRLPIDGLLIGDGRSTDWRLKIGNRIGN
jgi:hypothetical protein